MMYEITITITCEIEADSHGEALDDMVDLVEDFNFLLKIPPFKSSVIVTQPLKEV
jgi:hypothetical protein